MLGSRVQLAEFEPQVCLLPADQNFLVPTSQRFKQPCPLCCVTLDRSLNLFEAHSSVKCGRKWGIRFLSRVAGMEIRCCFRCSSAWPAAGPASE